VGGSLYDVITSPEEHFGAGGAVPPPDVPPTSHRERRHRAAGDLGRQPLHPEPRPALRPAGSHKDAGATAAHGTDSGYAGFDADPRQQEVEALRQEVAELRTKITSRPEAPTARETRCSQAPSPPPASSSFARCDADTAATRQRTSPRRSVRRFISCGRKSNSCARPGVEERRGTLSSATGLGPSAPLAGLSIGPLTHRGFCPIIEDIAARRRPQEPP
jgi:hypothetical protein